MPLPVGRPATVCRAENPLPHMCYSFFVAVLATALTGLGAENASGSGPSPAAVDHPVKEADLTTVRLTPEAEARLGIKVAAVERRTVVVTQLFPGEVVLPLSGSESSVLSPLVRGSLDDLLRLADSQADADGRVQQAEITRRLAEITLARAEKVLAAEAGSERAVDEARAQLEMAEAALRIARTRRELLGAPIQSSVGAKERWWIRVPVFAGVVSRLEVAAPAVVSRLSADDRTPRAAALPVAGPPTADVSAATVDLFYELEGGWERMRPGERLNVRVPLRGAAERLVAPWTAVLHDTQGGQWLYEKTGPGTFVRRRVGVERVVDGVAVLARGPLPPAEVVTDGAAELFGTEFGAGK